MRSGGSNRRTKGQEIFGFKTKSPDLRISCDIPPDLRNRSSEPQLRRELPIPLGVGIPVRGRRDPSNVRVQVARNAYLGIRVPQVHVVEQVHYFDAQLDVAFRTKGNVLEERRVHSPVAWTAQIVPWQVSEGPTRWTAECAAG